MQPIATLLVLLAPLLLPSCSTTRGSTKPVEQSGFLNDYSGLETTADLPGDVGPVPRYRFIDPDVDWASYDKLLLDPILFFRSEDIEHPPRIQELLNYFHAELRAELGRDYELVDVPGPGTLRLTIALTRAGSRNVTIDTISTWVPFGRAFAEIQGAMGDKPSGVGYAKAEAKFVDAESGELLLAVMDLRVGGKTVKDFDSWSDVRAAMDYWAELAVFRLCLLRGEEECEPPTR